MSAPMIEYKWGRNGHKQHLFPEPFVCVSALCGTGYSGDNPSYQSKAKKCKVCERLEHEPRQKELG